MSFILSALKKVENTRNLGSVPEVSSIQLQSFERPANRSRRIITVLSVSGVTALAVVAGLWLSNPPSQQKLAEQQLRSVLITPPVVDGVIPSPLQPPTAPASGGAAVALPALPAVPYVIQTNPQPVYYPQIPVINGTIAPAPNLYQNPAVAKQPEWEALPVGIVNYDELPNGLRQRMPNIQLSAHIYSDLRPQARKVIINGVPLREKQRLSDDLVVHQINADGVIMDYQGTLFLLGKNSIFN